MTISTRDLVKAVYQSQLADDKSAHTTVALLASATGEDADDCLMALNYEEAEEWIDCDGPGDLDSIYTLTYQGIALHALVTNPEYLEKGLDTDVYALYQKLDDDAKTSAGVAAIEYLIYFDQDEQENV